MGIDYSLFKFAKDKKETKAEAKKVYQQVAKEQEVCLLADNKCNGKMELHHVLYKSQGGKAKDNIAKLCLYHHQLVHSNKKMYQEILIKKLGGK